MSINPALLNALANPAIIAIPDDTAAAAALSIPTYMPLVAPVTITTLGAAWGSARAAAVYATLKALAASTDPSAPLAGMVVDVLSGPGFDARNATAQATVAQLVAAGICTQDEANAATCSVSYPLGAPVAAADVTAARRALANYQQILLLQTQVPQFFGNSMNEVLMPMLQALLAGNSVTPPASIDAMLATWKAAQNSQGA